LTSSRAGVLIGDEFVPIDIEREPVSRSLPRNKQEQYDTDGAYNPTERFDCLDASLNPH
jgi:hypothetical protein